MSSATANSLPVVRNTHARAAATVKLFVTNWAQGTEAFTDSHHIYTVISVTMVIKSSRFIF